MAAAPAALVLSLLGLRKDKRKVYAIIGTVVAGLTVLLYLVAICAALVLQPR